jgi:hypothetical protein
MIQSTAVDIKKLGVCEQQTTTIAVRLGSWMGGREVLPLR